MNNFGDLDAIKKLDPQDTIGSTEMLPQQLEAAWNEVSALPINQDFSTVKNIVFCGMGASIYCALVLKALQGPSFPIPSEVVSDYHLPNWVDENTLVVLASYSGTTEEVLSCAKEAKELHAKMVVLARGGPLADFAKENNVPAYIFDEKLNPARVPRLGCGYTILGLIGLLNKTKVIDAPENEIKEAITRLKEKVADLKTRAQNDSELFLDTIPVIFAAEHLTGNAQILRNQYNETSKQFSAYYLVPDLNHHLMEGLQFPKNSKLHFIVLNTRNYSPKIQRRMELTGDVVKQNGHKVHEFICSGQTFYDDFMETMLYGSYLTLYLGLRNDQNPAINPWVDYFKEKLR